MPNVLYKELSTCLVHANAIIAVKRNDLKTKYCLKTRSDADSQCLHARNHCYLKANFHSGLAARCGIPNKWYWRPRSEDASSTKSSPKSKRLILQLPAVEAVRLNCDCLSNSNTPAMSNPRAACGPVKVFVPFLFRFSLFCCSRLLYKYKWRTCSYFFNPKQEVLMQRSSVPLHHICTA